MSSVHLVVNNLRLPFSIARLAQSDIASDFYEGPGDRSLSDLKAASSTLAVG